MSDQEYGGYQQTANNSLESFIERSGTEAFGQLTNHEKVEVMDTALNKVLLCFELCGIVPFADESVHWRCVDREFGKFLDSHWFLAVEQEEELRDSDTNSDAFESEEDYIKWYNEFYDGGYPAYLEKQEEEFQRLQQQQAWVEMD